MPVIKTSDPDPVYDERAPKSHQCFVGKWMAEHGLGLTQTRCDVTDNRPLPYSGGILLSLLVSFAA